MRAFLAVDLPSDVESELVRLQAILPVGRPVPTGNLHLTLVFLGEQDEGVLSELHGELETLRADGFDLVLSQLGCFGGRSPKVLYAAAVPDPALADLHRLVVRAARRVGIALPRERFRPHVTLARFGHGLAGADMSRLDRFMQDHAGFCAPPAPVIGFSLFRSTLRPQGALHEELARYPLALSGSRYIR